MAGKVRAEIWLGEPARGGMGTPAPSRHDEAATLRRRLSADNALMTGALRLCETAHQHFEMQGDMASRDYIDTFSIELLGLIGDYLAARLGR